METFYKSFLDYLPVKIECYHLKHKHLFGIYNQTVFNKTQSVPPFPLGYLNQIDIQHFAHQIKPYGFYLKFVYLLFSMYHAQNAYLPQSSLRQTTHKFFRLTEVQILPFILGFLTRFIKS